MRRNHASNSSLPLIFIGSITAITLLGRTNEGTHSQGQIPTCPPALAGGWTADFPARNVFNVEIGIAAQPTGLTAHFRSAGSDETGIPIWMDGDRLRFQSEALPISFSGTFSADSSSVHGFIYHGSDAIHLHLHRAEGEAVDVWETTWTPLAVPDETLAIDLFIEEDAGQQAAFLFWRDPRVGRPWTYGLQCEGNRVTFSEKNLGQVYSGEFDPDDDHIQMTVTAMGSSAPISFGRLDEGARTGPAPRVPGNAAYMHRAPESTGDGWRTADPSSEGMDTALLSDLVADITDESLTLTHGVLIARHGQLVFEEYFYGFDRDTWHDMRSASKSLTSALTGVAIDRGSIAGVHARVLDFFPRYQSYQNWDERKSEITVQHLLNMSSGLDVDDASRTSVASESAFQEQSAQPDWTRFALDAPVVADPGSHMIYGTANPHILGGVIEHAVEMPLQEFTEQYLLDPLGAERYRIFLDPTGRAYGGGGIYLRPRDMAKFGQMYLDGGVWNGTRILSEEWVDQSLVVRGRLENIRNMEYGYLFWHRSYTVGNETIESFEARGAGGQFIFIVPSLDLVAVITSGNYRNGRFNQPEEIMERYILPSIIEPNGQ